MACCGGNCGCGSSCKCGAGCNGCGMYPDLGMTENMSTETTIFGVAPMKTSSYEMLGEMSYGENDGCNCGSDCKCRSACKCGK